MGMFTARNTLTAARLGLPKPTTPAANWRGYGIESGTNERVFLKGTSRADIEKQANGRAYLKRQSIRPCRAGPTTPCLLMARMGNTFPCLFPPT